ncbi:MAG: flagellar hook-basal body complex protein FliE [Firmicutes bacterium]|nr:flagellar hook-basal body complex protein FliE [Bacillota bacterium]
MEASMVKIPSTPSLIKWAGDSEGSGIARGGNFGEMLQQAIGDVNRMQQEADQAATKVVTGDVQDIHQAALAAEKAMLSLQLTLQVRSKVLEAYQEIIRMQV